MSVFVAAVSAALPNDELRKSTCLASVLLICLFLVPLESLDRASLSGYLKSLGMTPEDTQPNSQNDDFPEVPFFYILDKSLTKPLQVQARILDKCLVEHFLTNLGLLDYLTFVRQIFFLEHSEIASSLLRPLFRELSTPLDPDCLRSVFDPETLHETLSGISIRRPRGMSEDKLPFHLTRLRNLDPLEDELVLQVLENTAFIQIEPVFWCHYVNRTFVIFKKNMPQNFDNLFNGIFPDIKFARHEKQDQQLPFLDVLFKRNPNGELETMVYDSSMGQFSLDSVAIVYEAPWPLNICLHRHVLAKYNSIFCELARVKHAMWALEAVYRHLRTSCQNRAYAYSGIFQASLWRHEMEQVIRCVDAYFATQAVNGSWSTFLRRIGADEWFTPSPPSPDGVVSPPQQLTSVSTLDELCSTHEEYVDGVLNWYVGCLLLQLFVFSLCLTVDQTNSVVDCGFEVFFTVSHRGSD
ncbi:unnamed protein product [Schistocephalus solidus]|uniref:Gamma-tubulin complex component n=1 Tax=Schistocephalus solidus TaxID=70667 RepID=A0A3P7F240_SCHSO|nr:unnamed protein product [Schistocephalus solidus]